MNRAYYKLSFLICISLVLCSFGGCGSDSGTNSSSEDDAAVTLNYDGDESQMDYKVKSVNSGFSGTLYSVTVISYASLQASPVTSYLGLNGDTDSEISKGEYKLQNKVPSKTEMTARLRFRDPPFGLPKMIRSKSGTLTVKSSKHSKEKLNKLLIHFEGTFYDNSSGADDKEYKLSGTINYR